MPNAIHPQMKKIYIFFIGIFRRKYLLNIIEDTNTLHPFNRRFFKTRKFFNFIKKNFS